MKRQTHLIEISALLLYAVALIVIMYYHEPWFDEAQAWLIARDATIRELFTSIMHYEGHPPLWFLMLMPFAKSGVPFEIGIKFVNFMLVTLAMGIVIFKAPFHRAIRCTIPFTYFFFYQYGVISRTYSLMMLGFVLSALLYKDRNEKPFRFIAALSLICGASAYGILISAGIVIAWLWEIFGKSLSINQIKCFLKSKSFYALLILLIYNMLLLLCIYPYYDTYATNTMQKGSSIAMLFYMFFMAPADATCFLVLSNSTKNMSIYFLTSTIVMSCLIHIKLLVVTKTFNKQALYIVPYLLFALFAGTVYFGVTHIGIISMFYLFLFWCCYDERQKTIEDPQIMRNLIRGNPLKKCLYYGERVMLIMIIGVSISWSIAASINEISFNYGTGRGTSQFIKDNKLDQLDILVAWRQIIDSDSGEKYNDYNSLLGIPALAYFNENIFYNFNYQLNNQCYLLHKIDTNGFDTKKRIESEYPEVLLGIDNPNYTFGSEINLDDYALVKSVHGNTIWKNKTIENREFIFIRKDLLKNYPYLKPLNLKDEMIQKG